MGLYDQVNQTNTPFMSQFVGSVVPELNAYAGTMQKRYDTAADSDDALGEALGNLQHLSLDADTQYANELKSQYYQQIQDRAATGDFENMGRRTRQDAIRFSQAYQPLIQRQKDYAEVVKKIQADPTIADPATKQALIQQFQYNNTLKRDANGDFQRDGTGRIQLGGIQDAVYAPDVDINKKLLDELSKKEADIKAGRYFSDGKGNLINTIEKVRDPRYIAQLANQIQQTDPEIKAMIARDTNLQTYAMEPEEVKQHLVNAGLNKSPYQQLKDKGANKHEIAAYLKSQGMNLDDAKVVPLDAQKAQLMQSGMSEQAAEKAILNDQISKGIRNSHSGLVGGILGYKQESNDHMTDHMAVIRASAAAANVKDPNLMVLQGNAGTVSQEDPFSAAQSSVAVKKDVQATANNATTAILAAMKATGQSTGNVKNDSSNAIILLNNPVKLNALKLQLAKTNPQEATILENLAQSYKDKEAIHNVQQSHIEDIEKAGGMDWDKNYKLYMASHPSLSMFGEKNPTFEGQKKLSMDDFKDMVRSDDSAAGAFRMYYSEAMKKGVQAVNDGVSQGAGYHPIVPTGRGKTSELTDAINEQVLNGGIKGIDLNHPDAGSVDIAKAMGIDAADYAGKKTKAMEKGLNIQFNTESVGGKPTITATAADGTSHVFQAQDLPSNIQDELHLEVIRAGAAASTSAYGQRVMKQGYVGLGSTEMTDITPQYLKTVNPEPSGTIKRLNDNFSTKIVDAGGGKRRYILLFNQADGTTKPTGAKFDSVDDLTGALGKFRYNNVVNSSDRKILSTQR